MSAGFQMKKQDKPYGRLPLIRDWNIEMTGSLKDLLRDLLLEILSVVGIAVNPLSFRIDPPTVPTSLAD